MPRGVKREARVSAPPPVVSPDVAAARAEGWPATKPRMRKVADLVPYARNARTHTPEQVDQVARSIRRFGWTMPALVRGEDSGIIAGHARILAAARLGIDEVPTVEAFGWSDAEVRAYILADNKLALNAGWDEELLAAELADLREMGFELDVIGFSDAELSALNPDNQGKTDPDEVPEPGPEPVSRAGDVWICGPHRVLCGDSTSVEAVEAAMGGGAMADAAWTDPPYNVNYEGSAGKIANDDQGDEQFAAFLLDALVAVFAVLKPGSPIYVAHADTEGLNFRAAFKSAGFKLSGCLIWRKNALVLGRSDYQWQHEPVLYGWKPGASHRWFGGRKATTIADLDGTVFGQNADGSITVRVGQQSLIIRGTDLTAEPVEPTVIEIDRPKASADHPTMKPVALIERMLRNSTRSGDVVLDPFGGSGSTLIACHRLGRHARLVELDGRFVDVIVKRWQEFSGEHAFLEGDGRSFDLVAAEHFKGGGRGG
jgi:DNA modification methylase